MQYDLRVLKAPRLGGLGLRLFTWLAETWIFRLILAPKLMRDSGLPQARTCWAVRGGAGRAGWAGSSRT